MRFQRILIPLGCVLLLGAAFRFSGWAGLAVALGALVMWLLLHVTRMMQVLRRAAHRPMGHVDNAVMLHARLQPGATLLHVTAMTQSLGALQSGQDEQPALFRWTDATESYVTCEFRDGKLKKWALVRPVELEGEPHARPAP